MRQFLGVGRAARLKVIHILSPGLVLSGRSLRFRPQGRVRRHARRGGRFRGGRNVGGKPVHIFHMQVDARAFLCQCGSYRRGRVLCLYGRLRNPSI